MGNTKIRKGHVYSDFLVPFLIGAVLFFAFKVYSHSQIKQPVKSSQASAVLNK